MTNQITIKNSFCPFWILVADGESLTIYIFHSFLERKKCYLATYWLTRLALLLLLLLLLSSVLFNAGNWINNWSCQLSWVHQNFHLKYSCGMKYLDKCSTFHIKVVKPFNYQLEIIRPSGLVSRWKERFYKKLLMFNTVFHKNKINVRLGILLNICSPSIRNNRKEKKNHVLLVLLWSIVKCFALNSVRLGFV